MNWLMYIGILAGTFLLMEAITWLTHKFIMHGLLWYLHEDHHQKKDDSLFEKNDAFFVIFAVPSFCCILFGTLDKIYWLQAIGFGIMAYGFAYFIVHDVIIHQWFTRTNNPYVRSIRWAHKMHHKHLDRFDGESFGMLWVHKKYRDKIKNEK